MLPLFSSEGDTVTLKPVIQLVFEQLFACGCRRFFLIVGRGKRAIQDHFSPDNEFIRSLEVSGKMNQSKILRRFYGMIEKSKIVFVNQPTPKGFGDSVLQAEWLVSDKSFLVHAGDTSFISRRYIPAMLVDLHNREEADVTVALKKVADPRLYGVAEVADQGRRPVRLRKLTEKPLRPRSNLAIMPVYIFNDTIFNAIRHTSPGKGGEIQLTDAIQRLIDKGLKVQGVKLRREDIRLDVGTPEIYWDSLQKSHTHAMRLTNHDTS
jgi:UTP--glucose-1-phosphate uridylyltransferase